MQYKNQHICVENRLLANRTAMLMTTVSAALIGVLSYLFTPYLMLAYCLIIPLSVWLYNRGGHLTQQQVKSLFEQSGEYSDAFSTDCRIRMRYLAKNGVDVDRALQEMDGNVDKYNNFMLTFVSESHRREDELFVLLTPETMLAYGAKAHALRVKANVLGLTRLTDTAFFHEMEAYAGNVETVLDNWGKLSFELDEACDIFTDYIQALGLKDRTSDAQSSRY